MAAWTKVTEAERYIFTRADNLHQYVVWRHLSHFHAEQMFPYTDDGAGRASPEAAADIFQQWLEGTGNTVTAG